MMFKARDCPYQIEMTHSTVCVFTSYSVLEMRLNGEGQQDGSAATGAHCLAAGSQAWSPEPTW